MAKAKSSKKSTKAKKAVGPKRTGKSSAKKKVAGKPKKAAKAVSAKKTTEKVGGKTPAVKKVVAKKAASKETSAKRKTAGKTKKAAPTAKKKRVGAKQVGRGLVKAVRRSDARPMRGSRPEPEPPVDSAITIAGIEIVPRCRPIPKTKLRAKELREFKALLLLKRASLLGDVSQLSNEALNSNRQESRGDLSNMPSHMADIGSDNWEQEFTLGLIATERVLLRQIDDALDRLRAGTYGVCLATHRMISSERLRAKPWAQYCIEFARLRDAGRIPPGLV